MPIKYQGLLDTTCQCVRVLNILKPSTWKNLLTFPCNVCVIPVTPAAIDCSTKSCDYIGIEGSITCGVFWANGKWSLVTSRCDTGCHCLATTDCTLYTNSPGFFPFQDDTLTYPCVPD